MKYGRSQPPYGAYGILAPAARAALRFAARRNALSRYDAWRPVALFWRRRRKGPEGVRTGRAAPAAGAVWLPQFHLHFLTRVNDRPWRGSMPGVLPTAAIDQRRVVTDYQRTIVQSSMVTAQPRRDQRPANVFSLRPARGGSGTNVQAAASYVNSARRSIIVRSTTTWSAERAQRLVNVFSRPARSGSGANVPAGAPYANSARQLIVPPAAIWPVEGDQRPVRASLRHNARGDSGTKDRAAAPYLNPARRPIIASATTWATDHVQRPVRVFSRPNARGDSSTSVQAAAPYAISARRPIVPPTATGRAARTQRPMRAFSLRHARSDSGTDVQAAAPDASPARQSTIPPAATRVTERVHRPNLGQNRPGVRPGTSTDTQALHALQTYKRAPLVYGSRSAVMSDAVPPHSPEHTAPQPYFQPQELVWRRAMPPAAGIAGSERQSDLRELAPQAHGRSFAGQEAPSGMPQPFGHAPAAPALKIDSALMDRLTDDVIRRMERRERLERARRGL
jgi:hypothetical protein